MENYEKMMSDMVLDKQSVFDALDRINYYVEYYQTLLKYTKQTVRRKKVCKELAWWEEQLIEHQKMINSFNS